MTGSSASGSSMTGSFDADQFEQLVRAVTEEVLASLAASPGAVRAEDAEICAECDGRCVSKCADRAHRIMDAGADRISSSPSLSEVEQSIAALIDHTLLKPEASRSEVENLCREAVRFGFASV